MPEAEAREILERLVTFERDFDEMYNEPIPLLAAQLVNDATAEIKRLAKELHEAERCAREAAIKIRSLSSDTTTKE